MDDARLLAIARAVQDLVRARLDDSSELRALARDLSAWLADEARAAEARAAEARAASRREVEGRDAGDAPAQVAAGGPDGDAGHGDGRPDEAHLRTEPPAAAPAGIASEGSTPAAASTAAASTDAAAARPASDAVPKAPWTIGDLVAPDAGTRTDGGGVSGDLDGPPFLPLLIRRCRLKAEACRLYIERRAAAHDPVREPPLVDRVDALLQQARALPDCFLWVLYRLREQPDDESLDRIADAYDALADAADLVANLETLGRRAGHQACQAAFELMAEAISGLRAALRRSWLTTPDTDQYAAFDWLHDAIALRGIHLSRYLRRGDEADPSQGAELRRRIRDLAAAIDAEIEAPARLRAAYRQLRYHAQQIESEPPSFAERHVRRLADLLAALVDGGADPADRRLAEVVPADVAARVAEVASPDVRALLEQLHRPARTGADAPGEDEAEAGAPAFDVEPAWSERVRAVRGLLAGRQVVLVGGQPRDEAARRIQSAFGLRDVLWVRLTEHGTGEPMRAPIVQSDTALVLGLAKLGGHLHLDQARDIARSAGKPFVVLPAGYNPEQIATAVLGQASEQLRGMTDLAGQPDAR